MENLIFVFTLPEEEELIMKHCRSRLYFFGIFSIFSLILAGPAAAVLCQGPDGLTGACCTSTTLSIPSPLPGTTMQSVAICWNACVPSTDPIIVTLSSPAPGFCGAYQAQLTVDDISGSGLMSGLVFLDYTRTWTEFNNDGDELQVWRMAAKTDLMLSGTTVPCPVPICLAAAPTAFFYGHIDYAFNCVTSGWEISASLFHSCDRFIHDPIASSIPAPHHPPTAYAIVGPDVSSNPFVPTILSPFTGPITGGAIRRVAIPGTPCLTEDPLVSGGLGLNLQGCACPLSLSPAQYSTQPFSAVGSCGGTFSAINTPPPHFWKRMITTSLGTWTGAGPGTPYPGNENLWANEGFFFVTDVCTGITRVESHYGVMTDQGFPVSPDIQRPWLTMRMIDLASNFDSSYGFFPPFVGNVMTTSHTIHANF